ncbi:peroxisomal membrane anchor protein conserved region-domain-containing protein [Daldinia decipiens]|uniref:peroxisomal membrane anchor protein conserved region-domain-containing protein n=1 Tax=Daldinia decipiens TaxID=326647 RepID=UPI0020C57697|nr:peroxisomal membrane anchor protein conserved region-domain-containing protein [Daldinia decipiens]KAI1662140.1 peroxisomal membrane anchor protein conserved region-domain-containing protein [Daldinia decipiens]
MAIREDVVASAVNFLQDPNVISSPIENKLSFLRSKNLTQEEIDIAFARSGSSIVPVPASSSPSPSPSPSPAPPVPAQNQPYYGQYQTQPYGWQAPPEVPKRDWRDWFIMATVVGGVSYGLYTVSKRYLYPLVSPPTPEKLEQDKSMVDEQFEKAFATLEQLSKDTEELKASERERTDKLDKVLDELDIFMRDTKSASRRHEDETDRLREEMKALKGIIPSSMTANKEFTDNRLKEITTEVRSLKSLISQRMSNSSSTSPAPPSVNTNGFLKPTVSTVAPPTASGASSPGVDTLAKDLSDAKQSVQDENSPQSSSRQDFFWTRSSPLGSGIPPTKASIPAWQLAASKSDAAASNSQNEAGPSSSS